MDDSVYASIREQVRSTEFNAELERRLAEAEDRFKSEEKHIKTQTERQFEKHIADKDLELSSLRNELTRLNGVITSYEATKKSELSEIEAAKTKELYDAVAEKNKMIIELEGRLEKVEEAHKVALLEQRNTFNADLQENARTIIELKSELKSNQLAAQNRENQLREQHKLLLDDKQAEIERLKDFKLRLSTKMVGETLEQHCSILFERAQSQGLYHTATFEKDNTSVEHSKGDFIFRDFIDNKEYVSIMFEMKNEMDATATKHRNDDFLDKLDKDRKLKNCEYAVLVSMLEQDNELYNDGIVDKSHRYPKMIVIRPQFFLPVLRLISEGARKGYMERSSLIQELETARSTSLDFAKFEDKINRFRTNFNKNVTAAHNKFVAATTGIDKTIEALEKQIKALRDIKANFEASEQKLLKANELAEEDLTVKKLTHGNPTIRRLIQDASNESILEGAPNGYFVS